MAPRRGIQPRKSSVVRSRIRSRRLVVISLAVVIGVGALGYGGYFLLFDDRFIVTDVKVSGTKIVDGGEVQSVVEEDLEGKRAFIFSKKNSLIMPRKAITANVLNLFPRVKEVDLSVSESKELIVTVSEREPSYLWCRVIKANDIEVVDVATTTATTSVESKMPSLSLETDTEAILSGKEKCYYLDESGVIYARAPKFSGAAYVRFLDIEDESSEVVTLGSVFEPLGDGKMFEEIKTFIADLSLLGVEVAKIDMQQEDDVYLFMVPGWYLRYDSRQDLAELKTRVYALFESGVFGERSREEIEESLEYIDLRYDQKAYYRFK